MGSLRTLVFMFRNNSPSFPWGWRTSSPRKCLSYIRTSHNANEGHNVMDHEKESKKHHLLYCLSIVIKISNHPL